MLMSSAVSFRSCLPLLATALFAAGCGDTTSSTGELGRLNYSLFTDYNVPEGQLDEARIVTGHAQHISLTMTSKGRADIKQPENVRHSVSPKESATLVNSSSAEGDVPDFDITVTTAGPYVVSSALSGVEMDRIHLTFATPTSFDLLLKSRAPYVKDFSNVSLTAVNTIAEGSQITVDSAPLGDDGKRLAGMMHNKITVSPGWIAVPGEGVVESYENGIWTTNGQANFYFVEPGQATVTVEDPVSGAKRAATFDVTPIAHTP